MSIKHPHAIEDVLSEWKKQELGLLDPAVRLSAKPQLAGPVSCICLAMTDQLVKEQEEAA